MALNINSSPVISTLTGIVNDHDTFLYQAASLSPDARVAEAAQHAKTWRTQLTDMEQRLQLTPTQISKVEAKVSQCFKDMDELPKMQAPNPIGIINDTGSDCFLAALMQLILHTDPVLEKALIEEWQAKGPTREIGKFLHDYRQAQKEGHPSVNGISSIRTALFRVTGNAKWLSGQHDPHEVLCCIMGDKGVEKRLKAANYFTSEIVRRLWDLGPGRRPQDSTLVHEKDGCYWTIREELSGGEYVVPEAKLQPISTLLTAAASNEAITGFRLHIIDEKNAPQLDQPVTYKSSQRRLNAPPPLFTVMVKRYTNQLTRNDNPVEVEEKMVLPKELSLDKQPHEYELIGVEIQHGMLQGGHHFSYVKTNGQWLCLNDSLCTSVPDIRKVLKDEEKNIYIGRYRRIN